MNRTISPARGMKAPWCGMVFREDLKFLCSIRHGLRISAIHPMVVHELTRLSGSRMKTSISFSVRRSVRYFVKIDSFRKSAAVGLSRRARPEVEAFGILDGTVEGAFVEETGFGTAFFRRLPLQPIHVHTPFWPLASHNACSANSLVERKM